MQRAYLGSVAVKEQEWVDEQGQVVYQRDIEGAIGLQIGLLDFEHVGEVNHP